MILVTTDALAPEQGREAQAFGNLRLGKVLIGILGFANDKLADLGLR